MRSHPFLSVWIIPLLVLGCDPGEDDTFPGSDSDTDVDTDADGDEDTADCEPGPSGAATLERGCSPDDGPALLFTAGLAEATCGASATWPHVVVSLWDRTKADLSTEPTCWTFFGWASGQGYYQVSEDDWARDADRGYVRVKHWDGTTIEGFYSLSFDDGTCISGTYSGPWCDNYPKCG